MSYLEELEPGFIYQLIAIIVGCLAAILVLTPFRLFYVKEATNDTTMTVADKTVATEARHALGRANEMRQAASLSSLHRRANDGGGLWGFAGGSSD